MGLRFRKSVSLGKGVKLNIGKTGVSVSGGVKGLRVGVGPKGIRTTASLPGTGLSYSKHHSYKKLTGRSRNKGTSSKSRIEVIEGSQITKLLSMEGPKEIRSQFYMLQTILGTIGIICVFAAFLKTILLPIGALFIAVKLYWRKKTDPTIVHYKDILKHYRSKKYMNCIESIDHVLKHPNSNPNLNLIKAECYLNLEDPSAAYNIYHDYYLEHLCNDNSPIYWSAKVNAIHLALENEDNNFALTIAETLDNSQFTEVDNRLWRGYFKGLCFMAMAQYDVAIQAFQDAINRRRSMDEPYIDAHYQMGVAYSITGKNSLAKQRFTRVYSADTGYKNIAEIMQRIELGEGLSDLL